MGCGCTGNKGKSNDHRSNRGVTTTPRAAVAPVQPGTITNIRPMSMAPVQLPPPSGDADADKKARQKIRQDARLRALGRI